jgi:hypothetical protein
MNVVRTTYSKAKDGRPSTSGWRRAAHVNSTILATITVMMICCLIITGTRTKGLMKAYMFFSGNCEGSVANLNVGLHLVLNAVSTAVFASSNFFMQVLNSPSREEIDAIHAKGSYLSIGVPSIRNAFRVGRFKMYSWIVLLLSSIPIHILCNSMIFQTDSRASDYSLTIANEDFVYGAQYYAPGASLTPSGFYVFPDNSTMLEKSKISYFDQEEFNWGSFIWIGNYKNLDSEVQKNISTIAASGTSWKKVSAIDCYNTYVSCEGLTTSRNVIMIIKTASSWIRDDLWHLEAGESHFWDTMIPANESNALWFNAQCSVSNT